MATGPFKAYEKGLKHMVDNDVDFAADTIQAMLLLTAHTVDLVNDEFVSDVVADECADGDYARQTLASKAVTIVSGKLRFDCGDIDFGNSVTISARHLVFFKNTGADGTSQLLFIADLNTGGGNLSSTNDDFDITINANGIYELTINT